MYFRHKITILIASIILCSLFTYCQTNDISKVYIENTETINWKVKDSCTVYVVQNNDSTQISGRIKYRGGASSKYFKHSFATELDEVFSFDNIPADDDWIINASYVDKTFMRHKISYDLFNEMNSSNKASASTYTWLIQNNKDQGLYLIMQEINASFLELNKEDTMAMLFKEPGIFYELKNRYVKDTLNYYQQKYPKISIADKSDYLESFKNFLYYSSEEDFKNNISNWIDLDNVIDWHLILLFTNNGDGLRKNFFLYKKDSNSPFRFTIWDYDHSFGREGDYELNMMDRELNCRKVILLKRLMDNKELDYNERLERRWKQLREKNIFSLDNINTHIERNDQLIHSYISKNEELWPIESKWYSDGNNYSEEVELIRKYCKLRIGQLDERFGYSIESE